MTDHQHSGSDNANFANFMVGEGEMGSLFRSHDWVGSTLGTPDSWPQSLKMAVRIMLTSRQPVWIGWGHDLNLFYNDAHKVITGGKHPWALGRPAAEVWREIWNDIGPLLATAMGGGEGTYVEEQLLIMERNGHFKETYYTFSYSPIPDDDGSPGGIICVSTDDTERVIGERQLALLRDLAASTADTRSCRDVCNQAAAALATNRHDLPFSMLYMEDPDEHSISLEGAAGIEAGHPAAPFSVPAGSLLPWPFAEVLRNHETRVVSDLRERFGADLPTGVWSEAPTRSALLHVLPAGETARKGALVVGLNPFRSFDNDYRDFLGLVVGQIAAAIANADAHEQERRRADELVEIDRAKTAFLSNVSHEFRTPLTLMLAALEESLANFDCLIPEERERIKIVHCNSLRILKLVNSLLDFARIEAGRARARFEPTDLSALTAELASNFRSATAKVGLGLRIDCPPLAEPVYVDRDMWEKVVFNLLSNAFKFTFEGLYQASQFEIAERTRIDAALRESEREQLRMNQTLGVLVAERTAELVAANEKLRAEAEEREKVEQVLHQSQKMEAVGRLTGGVAHDFNNLLQVIGGNLQLLAKDVAANEKAEQRLRNALSGVARGSKLVSQLLAFEGRQPVAPKVVNLGRFVRGLDDLLCRALGEGVETETVISGGLWNTLVDPSQVENALLNLAINARDAMNGHGKLTIEAGNSALTDDYAARHADVTPGQYVMLAVTDTGCGMTPEVLEHVFEPFFTTKREGRGTGLGLSMVYGFVTQSGGHIQIYSEVGHGTTIRIYLPRALQAEDVETEMDAGPITGGTETVLVVEDNADVRDTVIELLSDLGYRVLKAREAQSALVIIESGVPIDLLFTDVVMPGPLRSPELARQARERLPEVAILFTSGYTDNAIVRGGRLDQEIELLSKPYSREALARKIRHVLRNQQQRNQAAKNVFKPERLALPGIGGGEKRLTILLVEDEFLIRVSTSEMLEDLGFRTLAAGSASEALTILSNSEVDVLMTDIGLPDMPGGRLALEARKCNPALRVIFATGGDTPSIDDDDAMKNVFLLRKPYDNQAVNEAIRAAIK
jgi:signal transduction histidine kinase/CheY-like chemotaxis protein